MFFPGYWLSASLYHQYLFLTHAAISNQVGDEEPLKVAKKTIPTAKINKDLMFLLHTTQKHSDVSESIEYQRKLILEKLDNRLKLANTINGLIVLLFYAFLIIFPIIGMYAPIFMLGDVVG